MKCELVFGTRDPKQSYQERPGAYTIIYNNSGQIAVAHVDPFFWLPGGGIDPGETPEECLHRELREEFGWQIQILAPIGRAAQYCFSLDMQRHLYKDGYFYLAQKIGEGLDKIEHDHHPLWLSPAEAMEKVPHESYAWAIQRTL